MNKQETTKILAVLSATYPQYYKHSSKDEAQSAVNVWSTLLADYPYQMVSVAVTAFLTSDKKGFPPVPGQIIDKIIELTDKDDSMSELEAWRYVSKATRNGNYGANEEFEKLPPVIQKIVGEPSMLRYWATLDSKEFETVVQSNFMRSYRTVVQREKEIKALPNNVKKILGIITESDGLKSISSAGSETNK